MKNPSDKFLFSLQYALGEDLDPKVALEFALQLTAWEKLTTEELLPTELQLPRNRLITLPEIRETFDKLSKLETLGKNKAAFESSFFRDGLISDRSLSEALEIIHEFTGSGLFKNFRLTEKSFRAFGREVESTPAEVAELMVQLAGDISQKRIYCPYDSSCVLAIAAERAGGDVYVENPTSFPNPWVINILTDSCIHIRISDPVTHPSYLEAGQLEKFDVAISFPSIKIKYDSKVAKKDWFDRFPKRITSGSVLAVLQIIAQTKGLAIIAVPNSILFSRGVEHALRRDLIMEGKIVGVIAMPPALLSFTYIPFSLLIINNDKTSRTVRFVDGGNEMFFERDGRNRSRLTDSKKIHEVFVQGTDEAIAITIPVEDIIKNDYNLEVTRYLLPPEQKKAEQILQGSTTEMLKKVVEIIRPFLKDEEEEKFSVHELSVSDFPALGYVKTPEKKVKISDSNLTSRELNKFLKFHDVILAVKGTVGKVAIIPDTVPSAEEGGWLVNQSCLILRARDVIDPRVLYMYLQSDLGQTLLRSIVAGSSIPSIQLKALEDLQIILPSPKEREDIVNTFISIAEIQERIESLTEEQKKLGKAHWGFTEAETK
ncbi:MAG: hypothetical protein N5P05_004427 (plasmid) [Chroococcopsis gigantea SAG 12.99]|jgi:type I restriction enzyme M protein|nr:N-6 DNA methylase [Chlorogloea purpurea SAG 13.99]MDV3002772.1 hypothetical protein [Chroococcopsis gigantea SAG 12.99]